MKKKKKLNAPQMGRKLNSDRESSCCMVCLKKELKNQEIKSSPGS